MNPIITDKDFQEWYQNKFKGSSLEELTAAHAWRASKIRTLMWALKLVQYDMEESDAGDAIQDELENL